MRLLVCGSVYMVDMNADIKNTVKECVTCMKYQQKQPHVKTVRYTIPYKPWDVVGAEIFSIKNNMLLCIVDKNSKFPAVQRNGGLLADDLITAAVIVFTKLDFQGKQCHMQARTSYQTDLNNFAGN